MILALIRGKDGEERWAESLTRAFVEEMEDGGMGSLRIVWPGEHTERHFGWIVAEQTFLDSDGVEISVAVNVDKQGDLFELDMWKVDFSPLKKFSAVG
ncbi:DUF6984 family protein [Bordetella sp. H567]|uniref:DUF6984 family protein n=1 Tax=Bordetella sp. H567 TaxID=1697043 RepID=UPI0011AB8E98|nr:hypothetical protein [Bordetella sp. H567]